MTTKTTENEEVPEASLSRMAENLLKVDALRERLTQVMASKKGHQAALDGPNQELFTKAAQVYWQEAMQNPAKIFEHQLGYWTKSVTHFVEAQQALAKGNLEAPDDQTPTDRRFANPLWQTHPYFNFLKQQYQINA